LGELLLGKPVFPGTSTLNQLERIMAITSRPTQDDIDSIESELAVPMLEAIAHGKPNQLHQIFPMASDEALDLIYKLL
jgi:mitogen-activated protein kinase 15